MLKQLLCFCQYILPQHFLSWLMGKLANTKVSWLKNNLIDTFSRAYAINLDEAQIADSHAYPTFNAFFTRALKSGARPINQAPNSIISPADGSIAQIGVINNQQLLQAKGMYFDLDTLFGGQTATASAFTNGSFATIYLAPHNYHRVHMPFTGALRQSIYIPGKLFSVNRMTSQLIPNLYARNERLIMIFDTKTGPMAVILVGALIVGSMQTVWMEQPIKASTIQTMQPSQPITLQKGDELGHFQLGSTVIVLFPQSTLDWEQHFTPDTPILVGQSLATLRLS